MSDPMPPPIRGGLGNTFKRPTISMTLPSTAGVGMSRILIGQDMPAPINNYSPFAQFGVGSSYSAAIIWYAEGDDTTYVYAAVVSGVGLPVAGVVFGHVTSGSIGEITAPGSGDPTGVIWRADTFGTPGRININADSSNYIVTGNTLLRSLFGSIGLEAPGGDTYLNAGGNVNLTAISDLAVIAGNAITFDGKYFSMATGNLMNNGPAVASTVTGTVFQDVPGVVTLAVPITKRYNSTRTNLRVRIDAIARCDTVGGVLQWGVRVDMASVPGAGPNLNMAQQKFDVANVRQSRSAERDLTNLAAGNRIVQLIWRGRAAGPIYTVDADDTFCITVEEVPV